MKSIFQCLVVFAVVFAVVFVCNLFINNGEVKNVAQASKKNDANEQVEYKVNNNLYFKNGEVELTLYKDNTYFLYEKYTSSEGSFKIVGEEIVLTQKKLYVNACYEMVSATNIYKVVFNTKNEITNVIINGTSLNSTKLDELKNTKEVLLNNNVDCSIKTTTTKETVTTTTTTTDKTNKDTKTTTTTTTTNNTSKKEETSNNDGISINITNTNTVIVNGKQVVSETNNSSNSNSTNVVVTEEKKDEKKEEEKPAKLTWKLEDNTKGATCAQVITKIYEDSKYDYSTSNSCYGDKVYVVFSNNTKYTIKEALKQGKVTVDELIKAGAKILKTEKRTEPVCAIGSGHYEIKFETNGGNKIDAKKICVSCADSTMKVSLPTPVKDGYKFAGWYKDKSLTKTVDTSSASTVGNYTQVGSCYDKTTTIYAKWEKIEEKTTCPAGSKLVKDPTLGNICTTFANTKTTVYPYACEAFVTTWDCPGTYSGSIEKPEVGCHADALVSSYNACLAAGCKIRESVANSASKKYYTEAEMKALTDSPYRLGCYKEEHTVREYSCNNGWTKLPTDEAYCYQFAK